MDTHSTYRIQQTDTFANWLAGLKDTRAKAAVTFRLRRVASGNLGDVKSVGGGVSEMRIDVGPGYRVYYTRRGRQILLLLVGGDKASQARDIARAQRMIKDGKDEDH